MFSKNLFRPSLFLLFVVSLCLFSCTDEVMPEEEEEEPMSTQVAHLEITVTQCIDASCSDREILPGASLLIYDNETDRDNFINEIRSAQTNVEGKFFFSNLQIGCAYINAFKGDIELKEKENTPRNSTSYLEIIFPFE